MPVDYRMSRDIVAGTNDLVTIGEGGQIPTEGQLDAQAISADGRFVLFNTTEPNLFAGDEDETHDVFLHDRQLGTTTHITDVDDGETANSMAMSENGNYILITIRTSGYRPEFSRLYLYDRNHPSTITSSSTPLLVCDGWYPCIASSVSNDGDFVFSTDKPGIADGDTNERFDNFLYDYPSGTITQISVRPDGTQLEDGYAGHGFITPDGRYIVYSNRGSGLVADDTNNSEDVFLYDRNTGTNTRVSLSSDGEEGDGASTAGGISDDGRYVTFYSDATNLVPGDTTGSTDVFVRDTQTNRTIRVSVAPDGGEADSWAMSPKISGDGNYVAFDTSGTHYDPEDVTNLFKVYRSTLDFVSPQVTGNTPANGSALKDEDEVTQISFNFNDFVRHDGTEAAANIIDNYLLVEAGENGSFDTVSCKGGVSGDDVAMPISSATYSSNKATVTVNGGDALPGGDYKAIACHTITDQYGNMLNDGSDFSFTFSYTSNEAPTDISLSSSSVDENRSLNSTVGSLTTTDPDDGDTFTYTLVSGTGSDDNGSFNISGSTLRTSAVFNYETKNSYHIRIRTTDAGDLFYEKAFTISIDNVNEVPVITSNGGGATASVSVEENGTAVTTVSASDVDAGDSLVYSITGDWMPRSSSSTATAAY